jgi:hypothetical protein
VGVGSRYLGSLYWAVETLTSPQYGNEAPRTRWELAAATARIGLFMAYDIAIGAYIMGTISLLVVKADERTGQYRDRAANLKQFVQQHAIPPVCSFLLPGASPGRVRGVGAHNLAVYACVFYGPMRLCHCVREHDSLHARTGLESCAGRPV